MSASRLPWASLPMTAMPHPDDNPSTEAKVELGLLLFHDPILSADGAVACVTCHSQYWGMTDGLPRSIGVGGEGPAGLGRTGPHETRRNAPTLWNVGYRDTLFWDGRADSLEDQILGPLYEGTELGRTPEEIVSDLRQIDAYQTLFEAAFPDRAEPIETDTFRMAIGAFERTLISDNGPYDQFVRGDDLAMSEAEIEGMWVFASLGCHSCHVPPLFESTRYEPSPVAALPEINDLGRFEVTEDPDDVGRFRVPTLRNLRETGPYFHTGAIETLDEAVAIEVLARTGGEAAPDDLEALITFLTKSLMDKSREPPRPETVPSGLDVIVDGFFIVR